MQDLECRKHNLNENAVIHSDIMYDLKPRSLPIFSRIRNVKFEDANNICILKALLL
jgi:hypothetical protein